MSEEASLELYKALENYRDALDTILLNNLKKYCESLLKLGADNGNNSEIIMPVPDKLKNAKIDYPYEIALWIINFLQLCLTYRPSQLGVSCYLIEHFRDVAKELKRTGNIYLELIDYVHKHLEVPWHEESVTTEEYLDRYFILYVYTGVWFKLKFMEVTWDIGFKVYLTHEPELNLYEALRIWNSSSLENQDELLKKAGKRYPVGQVKRSREVAKKNGSIYYDSWLQKWVQGKPLETNEADEKDEEANEDEEGEEEAEEDEEVKQITLANPSSSTISIYSRRPIIKK